MELLWEMTGWAGAVAMLGSYMSVSMGWLKPGVNFQALNLVGSCAFIINGTLHAAWPSVVTNVAWFLISAVALLRLRAAQQPASIESSAQSSAQNGALKSVETRVEVPEQKVPEQRAAPQRVAAHRVAMQRSPHTTDTGTLMVIPVP
jgi:hypothetical protein